MTACADPFAQVLGTGRGDTRPLDPWLADMLDGYLTCATWDVVADHTVPDTPRPARRRISADFDAASVAAATDTVRAFAEAHPALRQLTRGRQAGTALWLGRKPNSPDAFSTAAFGSRVAGMTETALAFGPVSCFHDADDRLYLREN